MLLSWSTLSLPAQGRRRHVLLLVYTAYPQVEVSNVMRV